MKRLILLYCFLMIGSYTYSQSKSYDFRDRLNGKSIYLNGYIDQPYVVVLNTKQWLCVYTTGSGAEGSGGQHIVSSVSNDKGNTWSKPVSKNHRQNLHHGQCPTRRALVVSMFSMITMVIKYIV